MNSVNSWHWQDMANSLWRFMWFVQGWQHHPWDQICQGEMPTCLEWKLIVNKPTPFQCYQKLFLKQIQLEQAEHKVKFNRFSLWNNFPSQKSREKNLSVAKPSAIYHYKNSVKWLSLLPNMAYTPGLSPTLLLYYTPHPSGSEMLPGRHPRKEYPPCWSWF